MNRWDFTAKGKKYLALLCAGQVLWLLIWGISHIIIDPSDLLPDSEALFDLGKDGRVELLPQSAEKIYWIYGDVRGKAFVEDVATRNKKVGEGQLKVWSGIRAINSKLKFKRKVMGEISRHLTLGNYSEALKTWLSFVDEQTPEMLQQSDDDFQSVTFALSKLGRIKRENYQLIHSVEPPLLANVFWITPKLSLLEVWWWALFGVITNLLVHSWGYLRKDQFSPREMYSGLIKACYGPTLAFIVVISILVGFLDVKQYALYSATMPLFGFIFGFYSGRTAALFKKFPDGIFKQVEASVGTDPKVNLKKRGLDLRGYLNSLEPRNSDELREQAKSFANLLIVEKAAENQNATVQRLKILARIDRVAREIDTKAIQLRADFEERAHRLKDEELPEQLEAIEIEKFTPVFKVFANLIKEANLKVNASPASFEEKEKLLNLEIKRQKLSVDDLAWRIESAEKLDLEITDLRKEFISDMEREFASLRAALKILLANITDNTDLAAEDGDLEVNIDFPTLDPALITASLSSLKETSAANFAEYAKNLQTIDNYLNRKKEWKLLTQGAINAIKDTVTGLLGEENPISDKAETLFDNLKSKLSSKAAIFQDVLEARFTGLLDKVTGQAEAGAEKKISSAADNNN